MKSWLQRILAILSCCFGLAGLVFPFRNYRTVDFSVVETVPGLGPIRIASAAACLAMGIFLLVSLYRKKSGMRFAIQIGSPGQQVAADAIVIAIGTVAAVPLVDVFLHRSFGVDPIADEEFARFMGAFFLIVAVPAVALYTSLIGAQWVLFDEDGIRLASLMSDKSLSWSELESIETERSQLFPVVKSGVPLARTLQKSLVFRSGDTRIAVMEPPESTKRHILQMAEKSAPEDWIESIRTAGQEWFGYESW